VVAAATLAGILTGANAVTAGFIYLVAVLGLAVWQGFIAGMIGSVLAAASFNFLFFPPIGTFYIADPQNWIALGAFLIATTIASRLVSRERERAAEAESRQREIEALYELCVDLFTADKAPGGLNAATSRALRTIGAQGGGLIMLTEGSSGDPSEAWIGAPNDLAMHRLLRGDSKEAAATSPKAWRNAHVPVTIGGKEVGILVAYGTRANPETLQSVARLLGLALERERFMAEQARIEALKASDSLKTALLQAVSHDLSTPLTAVLVSLESLKRAIASRSDASEAIEIIGSETTRLHRRIQNLLDLARLEAGQSASRREPTPPADLFRSVRDHLPHITSNRTIEAIVERDCPDLDVDPSLALEILVNLVENAHRASPPGEAIHLVARAPGRGLDRVAIEVLDRGSGLSLPATASPRNGASLPGDVPRKGLGLEIARRFAAAVGGDVTLGPRDGGGVSALIDFPASPVPIELPKSGV